MKWIISEHQKVFLFKINFEEEYQLYLTKLNVLLIKDFATQT